MGATEDERVDPGVDQRCQVGGDTGLDGGIVEATRLDQLDQPPPHPFDHLDAGGVPVDHRGVQLALERRRRGQDADHAPLRLRGGGLHRRLHPDERDVGHGASQLVQRRRRRRVAGHDDGLGAEVDEAPHHGEAPLPDLDEAPFAVRRPGLVGHVQHPFFRDELPHAGEDGQASHTRVEHPQRRRSPVTDLVTTHPRAWRAAHRRADPSRPGRRRGPLSEATSMTPVGDPGGGQRGGEGDLFLRVEAHVRVDGELHPPLSPAPPEQRVPVVDPGLGEEVDRLPCLHDPQVRVGVEAVDELGALMSHVRLQGVLQAVAVDRALDDLLTGAGPHRRQRHERLVPDHPGEGEARCGRFGPVLPPGEGRVGRDRGDLLEVVDHLQRGDPEPGGHRDDQADAVGMAGGQREGHQPPGRPSHGRVEPPDTEVVEQSQVGLDHVAEADRREARAIGPPGGGVGRRRPARSVAATQVVGADHEPPIGVDGPPRADQPVPPAEVHLLGPPGSEPGHVPVDAGGVLAPAQGVEQQDGVGAVGVEGAVRLVGQRHLVERPSSRQ